jgi:hypothetical protein
VIPCSKVAGRVGPPLLLSPCVQRSVNTAFNVTLDFVQVGFGKPDSGFVARLPLHDLAPWIE